MTRSAAALVVVAAVVAGCGSAHRAAPPQPKVPHDVAAELATLSDQVAAQLDGGNACAALAIARQLDTRTAEAISGGRVPVALARPLRTATSDLVNRIQCAPPQAPPAEHGNDKGKEHGKHKGHDGGGD